MLNYFELSYKSLHHLETVQIRSQVNSKNSSLKSPSSKKIPKKIIRKKINTQTFELPPITF